ncbi:MAG: hypothetical protein WA109_03670 [Bellilinea sp.]
MNDTKPFNSETVDPEIFWNEFRKITNILQSDLNETKQHLNTNDSQFWRRTFYRSSFAYLEGQTYALRQLFLFYDWWTVDQDYEDKIRNKKRVQNKDGSENVVFAYLPFVQNIKLLFKAFAIASDIDPLISDNDKAWELLSKAVNVRNRIVHPKKSVDLFISDNEIQLIMYVGGWLLSTSAKLLKKRIQADIKTIKAMDECARKQFGQPIEPSELDLLIEKFENEDD